VKACKIAVLPGTICLHAALTSSEHSHTALSVSNYLGALQGDPYSGHALEGLQKALRKVKPKQDELQLLRSASQLHIERGEWWAAAALIEMLARFTGGKATEEKITLWNQLAELRSERLLDAEGALEAYEHALKLSPKHANTRHAREELRKLGRQWQSLVEQKQRQAQQINDETEKALLITEIGALLQKFEGNQEQAERHFKEALALNPREKRAVLLYANLLRKQQRWEDLVNLWLSAAESCRSSGDKALYFEHAARLLSDRLQQRERAAACFERVISHRPGDRVAMAYLAAWFTEREAWDDLVELYESALRSGTHPDDEEGALLQIGMIHWRKRQSVNEAEPYFARLRKLDPAHPAVLDFYEGTLTTLPDQPRLLGIFHDAQRAATDSARRLRIAFKVAEIAAQNPVTLDRSIEAWKTVLQLEPSNALAIPALKELYARSGRWSALAELLKSVLEEIPPEDKAQQKIILGELLSLYRDQLHSDVMVANVYNSILQIAPDDREALAGLASAYEQMGRWNDLIQILHRQAEAASEPEEKVGLLRSIATLWIDHFANLNQAAAALQQVLSISPDDLTVVQELREILVKKRAWKDLYALLESQVERVTSPVERQQMFREMAELASDRLANRLQALKLWKQIALEDSSAIDALDAIEKLAEQEQDWASLADVLERRLELLRTDIASVPVLERLGVVYAEHLKDGANALSTWQRLLAIDPQNRRAVRSVRQALLDVNDWDSLESLYAQRSDWEGLVDVLGTAADRVESSRDKIELSLRAARVYEEQIGAPHRAFRSYERILSVEPDHQVAARALVPIYEKEEKWNRLVGVLRILLRQASTDASRGSRLELLRKLTQLCLEKLRDGDLAFVHALEAFKIEPSDSETRDMLEQAALLSKQVHKLAEAYKEVLSDVSDATEHIELHRKLAQHYLASLNDPAAAIPHLQVLVEADPGDTEAVDTLERLLRGEKKFETLRDVYLQRIGAELNPARKVELLRDLAVLEESTLSDIASAASRYRDILALDPVDIHALNALEGLAAQSERWDDLAQLLERHFEIAERDSERIDLAMQRGRLLHERLNESRLALVSYQQALDLQPEYPQALAALEALANDVPSLSPEIDPVLESAHESTQNLDGLAKVLERSLNYAQDKQQVRLRIAEVRAQQDDAGGTFAALRAAFLAEPHAVELWPRLEQAAKQARQLEELAQAYADALAQDSLSEADAATLCFQLAVLYEQDLQSSDRAEPCYRKVLALDPSNVEAFEALRSYYSSQEQWSQLQALYHARANTLTDAQEKIAILLQLSFLHEEILDAPLEAIRAYEAVVELDPEHARARRALENLYVRTNTWDGLARLLQSALETAEGLDSIDLIYRLGELHEARLDDPATAVDYYASALAQQPTHLRAQAGLERLVNNPTQRARVAEILEPLYESQGAYAELARILYVQLEDLEDPSSRVVMLGRIAEIQESKVRDLKAALDSLLSALLLEPSDMRVREEASRLAEATGRNPAYGEALQRAVAEVGDNVGLKKELLFELARVWDEREHAWQLAAQAYTQLVSVDAHDVDIVLPASRALARIHERLQDHRALADDLERIVALEHDSAERHAALVQLGALYEDTLNDNELAISAYERRVQIDPTDFEAMVAWERLLEQTQQWSALITVLKMESERHDSPARQKEAAKRVAELYETELGDADQAILVYEDLTVRFGADTAILSALARLYEQAKRWDNLLEVWWSLQESSETAAERIELRFRAASLLHAHIHDLVRAVEMYREVLALEPQHALTIQALDTILQSSDSVARIAAARALADCYATQGRYDKLVDVLVAIAASDDRSEAFVALQRAARIALKELRSPDRAFDLMSAAARMAPDENDLRNILPELQAMAAEAASWQQLLELFKELIPNILDEDLNLVALRLVADIARMQVKDSQTAREYYRVILDRSPDDTGALDALEELDASVGNHEGLLQVLKRKTELAESSIARIHLLLRQADIAEKDLRNMDLAIEAYEQVMQESERGEAYEPLERLYRQTNRWVDLAFLYDRALEQGLGDRLEVRHKLAIVFIEHREEPEEGIEHFRRVLEENSDYAPSIEYLERLVHEGKHVTMAAELLEPLLLVKLEWQRLVRVMDVHCDAEPDPQERMRLLGRLAETFEDHLEDLDSAMTTYAKMFRLDPSDSHAQEALSRLARVLDRWEQLALVYEDVVAEVSIPDLGAELALTAARVRVTHGLPSESTVPLLSRVLAVDPEHVEAFELLEQELIRTAAYGQLTELYAVRVEQVADEAQQIELLHRQARVFREHLGDIDRAVEVYHRILELEPDNAPAARALDDTLLGAGKWQDLADFLLWQADRLIGSEVELQLRHRLAQIYFEQLNLPMRAVDILEQLADAHPHHGPTVEALEHLVQHMPLRLRVARILERVYEATDQWKKLIAIYQARAELSDSPDEKIELYRLVAALHEERGENLGLAMAAWSHAFRIDPSRDDLRYELERLAEQGNLWAELAASFDSVIQKSANDQRVGLLENLADLYDKRVNDPLAAIRTFESLLDYRQGDEIAPVLGRLTDLYASTHNHSALAANLMRRAELSRDPEEQFELWMKAATTFEDLKREPEAIDAYRRATEANAHELAAWDALDRLFDARHQYAELTPVIATKAKLSVDPPERAALMLRLSDLYETRLHQPLDAIQGYLAVLEDDPANRSALDRLTHLYRTQGLWRELVSHLQCRIEMEPQGADAAAWHADAARVRANQLGDPDGGFEQYARAIEIDPTHEPAIHGLVELAETPHLRDDVRAVLVPLLRQQQRWDDLAHLYSIQANAAKDQQVRHKAWLELARLHEHERADAASAHQARRQAFLLTSAESLLEEKQDLERLAEVTQDWNLTIQAYRERINSGVDPKTMVILHRAIAAISEHRLNDVAGAINALQAACQTGETDQECLGDLQRLFMQIGDWSNAHAVLEQRLASTAADNPEERLGYLELLSELERQKLGRSAAALERYRQMLELDPSHVMATRGLEELQSDTDVRQDVLATLESVYRTQSKFRELAVLYDLKMSEAKHPSERLRLLDAACQLWEHELSDSVRALGFCQQGFRLSPEIPRLERLEQLAESSQNWALLRGIVEDTLQNHPDLDKQTQLVLFQHAANWYLRRLADPSATSRIEEALRSNGQLKELVEILEAKASTLADQGESAQAASVRSELGDLMATEFQDLSGAIGQWEQASSLVPERVDLLERLAEAYARTDNAAALVATLERQMHLSEVEAIPPIANRIATLSLESLKDVPRAEAALRRAREAQPQDQAIWQRMRALYEQSHNGQGMIEQLAFEVQQTVEPAAKIEKTDRRCTNGELAAVRSCPGATLL
jgi:tetratricopeptide (TPR) repeat protein